MRANLTASNSVHRDHLCGLQLRGCTEVWGGFVSDLSFVVVVVRQASTEGLRKAFHVMCRGDFPGLSRCIVDSLQDRQ